MPSDSPLPPHDGGADEPKPTRIVTTWPEGSFVENIAIDAAGTIFVSLHPLGEIHRVTHDGVRTLFATLPTPVAGLAFDASGALFVSGGTPGTPGGVIWRVGPDGGFGKWLDLPAALFLNGITPAPGGGMLVVDSALGQIWHIATDQPAAALWLAHESLTPLPGVPGLPGVNGIKRFGDRYVVSNTARAQILEVALDPARRPGPPSVIAGNLRADDLAFDAEGSVYATTHMQYSLVRLTRAGTRATLAGPAEGMVGSTAAAFGRTSADRTALYVTTTGGVFMPYQGTVQPAKLVRVEIGIEGAPLGSSGRAILSIGP